MRNRVGEGAALGLAMALGAMTPAAAQTGGAPAAEASPAELARARDLGTFASREEALSAWRAAGLPAGSYGRVTVGAETFAIAPDGGMQPIPAQAPTTRGFRMPGMLSGAASSPRVRQPGRAMSGPRVKAPQIVTDADTKPAGESTTAGSAPTPQ